MDIFIKIFNCILNIIFPPKCCICGMIGDDAFCPECVSQIKYTTYEGGMTSSAAIYEGVIKKAIKKLKFNKKKRLAPVLSKIMLNSLPFSGFDVIVPVPLHRDRLRKRGFNQSQLLAKDISEFCKAPLLTEVLIRQRPTTPQFGLDKAKRVPNVKGAFCVKQPDMIKGKAVLLVDDILTTGATTLECKKELLSWGAAEVFIYTLSKA
ncbi:MAG: ComF family protein [Candidatus Margulisiibacteriota bacterium]